MRIFVLLFFFISFVINSPACAGIKLKIAGLDGELKKNVNLYLKTIPETEYALSGNFKARLSSKISLALKALGYYHPEIQFEGKGDKLTVRIKPGPAMIVSFLDVKILGEAEKDKDFILLMQQSGLKEGIRLRHDDYDNLKAKINSLALEKGYFKGSFEQSRIEVSPPTNRARIVLQYQSGNRYKFGSTVISGSQIETERVLSMETYTAGEPYRMRQISGFSQNLMSTNWFSSVIVQPDFSQLDETTELPVNVTVTPASKNQLETGIGYSTDVGIRGSLSWTKPWLNAKGHSFTSDFSLSAPEQSITAGYKIPLRNALNEYYLIQYGLKKEDNLDTQSIASNLSLERHWLKDKGWNKALFIHYLIENYEQGVLDDVGQFVLPGGTLSRTRARLGANQLITWGDEQSLTLEYGNQTLLSETDLLRLQAGTSWIRSYGKNHRGILRLSAGANLAKDFTRVAPSLRFFAGGDNSIRGYNYESISPTDSSGALTGAKYLATTSIEYQYRLFGKWWGALFYDYGDAFNDQPEWKRGTGFGVRWISPLGPLQIDFAWGLESDPGDQFKIHFTLGPEL